MTTPMNYLWIAIGGAIGSTARFWCSDVIAHRFPSSFPWGTIAVNISGSFLIGVLAAIYGPGGKHSGQEAVRQFLVVGFCGGYTTFSAFSMQTLDLARAGEWISAGGNVLASVTLCLLATGLGFVLGSSFGTSR